MRRYLGESLTEEAKWLKLHEMLEQEEFDSLVQKIFQKLDLALFAFRRMVDIYILLDVIKDIRKDIDKSARVAYGINVD